MADTTISDRARDPMDFLSQVERIAGLLIDRLVALKLLQEAGMATPTDAKIVTCYQYMASMLDPLNETMKLSRDLRRAADDQMRRRGSERPAEGETEAETLPEITDQTAQAGDGSDNQTPTEGSGDSSAPPIETAPVSTENNDRPDETSPSVSRPPASETLAKALDAVAKTEIGDAEDERLKDAAQNGDRVRQFADGSRILGDIATHEAREMVTLLYALWHLGSEVRAEKYARHILDCMLTPIAELRRLLFADDELSNG